MDSEIKQIRTLSIDENITRRVYVYKDGTQKIVYMTKDGVEYDSLDEAKSILLANNG